MKNLTYKQWVALAAAMAAGLGVLVDQHVFSDQVTAYIVAGVSFLKMLATPPEK